eukprot:c13516_g1_i1 orf=590-2032(-)
MELRLPVGLETGYGNVCCCSTSMLASPTSSSLSFCNTFKNPLLNSLLYKPYLTEAKQKTVDITARVKWQKDLSLDLVIQRQKKVKLVTRIKDLLIKEPGMCMSLRALGKHRKKLGIIEHRRLVTLLNRYPAVFDVFEEGVSNMYFRLTAAAEDLFLEEQKLKADMESLLVCKIRKLLMMSMDKTLLMYKLAHLKKDLGLPDDFKTNLVEKYPEFFKVVELEAGPALELTSWDPELAISAWEKKLESGPLENGIVSSHTRNSHRLKFPKSYHLKRRDKEAIRRFRDLSFVSPYAEFAHLDPTSLQAEKHACAVVHEILSMTLERRVNIDFLTHFRRDYKFSQQLHGMLVRHPELFYVSLKGDRDSVFLREAYRGSELIDKEPLVIVKEKLRMLVAQDAQESKQGVDEYEEDEEDDFDEDNTWSGDEVATKDASDDEDEVDASCAQSMTQAPDIKERVPRRPLIVLQKEQEMAAFVSSAERW